MSVVVVLASFMTISSSGEGRGRGSCSCSCWSSSTCGACGCCWLLVVGDELLFLRSFCRERRLMKDIDGGARVGATYEACVIQGRSVAIG